MDAAWLWEEYLAVLLGPSFRHCVRGSVDPLYLFHRNPPDTGKNPKGQQLIIPDFVKYDQNHDAVMVADAKYIPLLNRQEYEEESATAILYKTITYMYRLCLNRAYLLYPVTMDDEDSLTKVTRRSIISSCPPDNGGEIVYLGLPIPENCASFTEFAGKMALSEKAFLASLHSPSPAESPNMNAA